MKYTYDFVPYSMVTDTDYVCIEPDQDLIMRTWLSIQSTGFSNVDDIAYFQSKQWVDQFYPPQDFMCIRRKEGK